ncbi:MAG: DJ-1/PfpI family protein [Candidatus Pacebacteria bacterium]|nr:DJ-1/PfpI family protein [Candidatus Paceibacterota bacterium]
MKSFTIILAIGIIILISVFLVYKMINEKAASDEVEKSLEKAYMEKSLQGKKIAIIIAFRDFKDEEYFIPKNILESAGALIYTISSSLGTALGSSGGEAEIDRLLKDLNVSDYDAVLFIGGSGASKYIDDKDSHRVIEQAVDNNKVLGAICIAPAILAKAGVLKGKKAAVWSSLMDKSAVKILKEEGALYLQDSVVIDGKIITASGPDYSKEFSEKVIEVLKNE